MRRHSWLASVALAAVFACAPGGAGAQTLTTLYTFQGGADGQLPAGGVTLGPKGRVYGTTYYGGAYGGVYGAGGGEVYELVPPAHAGGMWTKTALVNFYGATMGQNCAEPIISGNGVAGYAPDAPPRFDKSGNLFAAASQSGCDEGTIVELSAGSTTGSYSIANVLQFQLGYPARGDTRGNDPQDWGGLVFDASGNVYGTTVGDGENGSGELFKLSPGLAGNVVNLLVSFSTGGALGDGPQTGVVFGPGGSLIGTTSGSFSGGPPGEKIYQYKTDGSSKAVYTFTAATGVGPGPLVWHKGKIYGTTNSGGTVNGGAGVGVVYQLSQSKTGWVYTVLHSFSGLDGENPFAIVFDKSGDIIGNASGGGSHGGGVIFKLTPPAVAGMPWGESTLWNFANGADGNAPVGSLAIDASGAVYGSTAGENGGVGNFGTVFKLVP